MKTTLEERKEQPKRRKTPIRQGPVARLGASGLVSLLLNVVAWGGAAAVAFFVVSTGLDRQAADDIPRIPLEASAGAIARGERAMETAPPAGPQAPAVTVTDTPGTGTGGATAGTRRPAADETSPSGVVTPPHPRKDDGAATKPTPKPEEVGGVVIAAPEDALAPPTPPTPKPAPEKVPEKAPEKAVEKPASKTPPADGCKRYPVIPGDATSTIARRLKVSKRLLRKWNPKLASDGPVAGSDLRICVDKKVVVSWKEKTYKVRGGDTVLKIARAHGLSIGNVVAANGIDPDKISVGQKLKIHEAVWE